MPVPLYGVTLNQFMFNNNNNKNNTFIERHNSVNAEALAV